MKYLYFLICPFRHLSFPIHSSNKYCLPQKIGGGNETVEMYYGLFSIQNMPI